MKLHQLTAGKRSGLRLSLWPRLHSRLQPQLLLPLTRLELLLPQLPRIRLHPLQHLLQSIPLLPRLPRYLVLGRCLCNKRPCFSSTSGFQRQTCLLEVALCRSPRSPCETLV